MDSALYNWEVDRIMAHNLYSLLPYLYVRNNPLNRFDLDGYVDWLKVSIGSLGVIGGAFETALGGGIAAGTGVTVIGAAGGAALMMHGLATIGFGVGNIITGITESDVQVQGGPLEAVGEVVEQGIGMEGASEVGKAMDLGVQVASGGNPIKGLTKAGNLLPTSAKEAVQAGNYQIQVAKEFINIGSQSVSAVQLEDTIEEIIKEEEKKDE